MNTQRNITTFLAAFAALVALALPSQAAAQSAPEAFVGTFMPHGLDGRDYVDAHMDLFRDAMQGCYESHLDRDDSLAGLMLMRVYVDSDGTVSDVDIVQNRTGSNPLASCVEDSIEAEQLAANHRDNVSITLPVTFRMRDTSTELAHR